MPQGLLKNFHMSLLLKIIYNNFFLNFFLMQKVGKVEKTLNENELITISNQIDPVHSNLKGYDPDPNPNSLLVAKPSEWLSPSQTEKGNNKP